MWHQIWAWFVEYGALVFGALAVALTATIAFRANINFDFNRLIEQRHEQHDKVARALCTHAETSLNEDGLIMFRATILTPPGTLAHECRQCGIASYDHAYFMAKAKHWADNPEKWMIAHKKVERHHQKFLKRWF